jgi:meso-butanediol dehydrogenase / (S,S)-butanediol dehydrogenase / diacetyl reductase
MDLNNASDWNSSFDGRIAVVTGAASGIGFACAALLASRGAQVALLDISADQGKSRADQIGRSATFFATDVSSENSVATSVQGVVDHFGRFDVLINCAAIQMMGTLLETSGETWDRLHQVNLKGVFLVSKAAMPHLQHSGSGAIVNVSSILGIVADPDLTAYGAMKGGVIALTKSMALAYGSSGVRVNCICPGDVNTPMVAAYFDNAPDPAALRAEVNSKYALRRIAEPTEIAEVVAFLASPAASFMTGSTVVVDGGLTSKCY